MKIKIVMIRIMVMILIAVTKIFVKKDGHYDNIDDCLNYDYDVDNDNHCLSSETDLDQQLQPSKFNNVLKV